MARSMDTGNYDDTLQEIGGKLHNLSQLRDTISSLQNAQIEAAMSIRNVFDSYSSYPEVAMMVRLSGNRARSLHQHSASLITGYVVIVKQILKSVLPLIFAALDQGEGKMVEEYFEMVVVWSRDKVPCTLETKKGYSDFQLNLENDIQLIAAKVESYQHNLENEIKKLEDAKTCFTKGKPSKEICKLSDVYPWDVSLRQSIYGILGWTWENIITPLSVSLTRPIRTVFQNVWDSVAALMPENPSAAMPSRALSSISSSSSVGPKNSDDERGDIKGMNDDLLDARNDKAMAISRDAEERERNIQQSTDEIEKKKELINQLKQPLVNSLPDTTNKMGLIIEQLEHLAKLWEGLSQNITCLKTAEMNGKPLLDNVQKDNFAKILRGILEKARKDLILAVEMGECYINIFKSDSHNSISKLYSFLSGEIVHQNWED